MFKLKDLPTATNNTNRDRSLIMGEGGGGALDDKYKILNIFRADPDRKTFIFKMPPPSSKKFKTPCPHSNI
jgi:hypothetical protein